jgi:hypothetical protein
MFTMINRRKNLETMKAKRGDDECGGKCFAEVCTDQDYFSPKIPEKWSRHVIIQHHSIRIYLHTRNKIPNILSTFSNANRQPKTTSWKPSTP